MNKWQEWSDKFLVLTPREQYLIIATGLIAIIFITFSLFIDAESQENDKLVRENRQLENTNNSKRLSIETYQEALAVDPNKKVESNISAVKQKLLSVDEQLLTLTSQLIDPIQMRFALIDLLKLQSGVNLKSFELIGAKPLLQQVQPQDKVDDEKPQKNPNKPTMKLYRHGIKLTLEGNYFSLRNYLQQLETMPWKFFWQDFNYKLDEYPSGKLSIEIYSLSTQKEFIGV